MGQSQSEMDNEVALAQIQGLYKKFVSECPSGNLHLHEFKRIFGITSKSTEEECAYMENLFRTFDTNQDNTIDFMEYVAALHLVLRGRLEDKLKWSFKVYDRDGNGCLDKREVTHVIKTIHTLKMHENSSGCGDLSPDQICDRIFELVDKNNDGEISLEEFLEGAQRDKWVMEQLKLDVRPSGWFLEQQKKCSQT
ncbi:guanylyl cyclase-activating protein 2-like [Myxocyprinus asiaticus]|uniref:guanylyl cyclase-activating protein 2-like n=1 Tax=Myxocyprinus asiaticus TaxID=70543 RepID=UPI0022221DA9|nr:guanylyl cyclase-activating protein 2-like [Myxocyprinus asiaticus]